MHQLNTINQPFFLNNINKDGQITRARLQNHQASIPLGDSCKCQFQQRAKFLHQFRGNDRRAEGKCVREEEKINNVVFSKKIGGEQEAQQNEHSQTCLITRPTFVSLFSCSRFHTLNIIYSQTQSNQLFYLLVQFEKKQHPCPNKLQLQVFHYFINIRLYKIHQDNNSQQQGSQMKFGRILNCLSYFSNMKLMLRERVESKLQPIHLQIEDESRYHSRGQETHFNMLIVSQQFQGLSKVKKHQLVYQTLGELMNKIHALTLTCQIQSEYKQNKSQNESPGCSNKAKKN